MGKAEDGVKTRGCAMRISVLVLLMIFFLPVAVYGARAPVSEDTEACIECHSSVHPGIVADWKKSRMARVTPSEALKKKEVSRRISVKKVPNELAGNVVGCAECHTLNPERHRDTFDHEGYKVHVVVTPKDCATCHPVEASQYSKNLMSHAYGNLNKNPVYHNLMETTNGVQIFEDIKTTYKKPDATTSANSCNYCHGTKVEVQGVEARDTDFGELEFPVLTGWPNQGVGRINPDGSMGSCSSCHTRHQFSIKMARKPYTCSECHKGPDVPAYKVYQVSKHGNIFSSLGKEWKFDAVPWIVGKDFSAPTCASCHVSLVVSGEGEVPVAKYLIDAEEQERRQKTMQNICLSCHSHGWVEAQFARFENVINTTNEMTLTATKILLSAWEKGAARGLSQNDSIFNEAIEKKWVEQWLFFANSTRYASAMAGADYGVFANGRWYMSKNIQEMVDWLEFKLKDKK
jgi:hypothetical protein